MIEKHVTDSEEATYKVARNFARMLSKGDVVALTGELGVGKTVFVKGVLSAYEVNDNVTSPTFILINEYRANVSLYHIDLYRLFDEQALNSIGIEEYLYSDGICLVEWAEKIASLLPVDAIHITMKHNGGNSREITIERIYNQ